MNTSKYFYQFLGIILLFLLINDMFAQRVQANRWYLSGDGGVSVFFGDVKRYDYLPDWESPSEMQPMFSASAGRELSPVFSIRGQFTYGDLSGHKKSSRINFKSTILGGHILTDINLIYLLTNTRFGSSRFNIYGSLGLGYLSWDTKLYYDTPKVNGDLMAESKTGALSIPGSLTVEYLFTRSFSVKAEGMLYVITSDEVDAKPGGIAMDMINYNSLGVCYKFKPKRKAKQSRIKYALDPALYEPRVEEVAEEPIEEPVEETVEETPILVEEIIIEPQEELVIEEKIVDPEVEVVETPAQFVIDHELEAKAIDKEKWTPADEDPWPEIEFTVQILAAKNKKDVVELQRLFNIKDRIVERYDGTWYRYSVGRFDKIWRARELRNVLRSRNNIDDAFLAVYKDNVRISLKETMEAEEMQGQEPVMEKKEAPKEEHTEEIYPLIHLTNSVPFSDGVIFGVQVLSIKNDHYRLGEIKGVHGIDKPILVNVEDPWYQIVIHGFDTYDQARAYQIVVEQKGFTDSFVVAFKNGKKIELSDLVE